MLKNKLMLTCLVSSVISSQAFSCYAMVSADENHILNNSFSENPSLEYVHDNESSPNDDDIPIHDYGCSELINEHLSIVDYYLSKYDEDANLLNLDSAIKAFGEIAKVVSVEDLPFIEGPSPVEDFFIKIRDMVYGIPSQPISSEYLINFSKEILFGWRKNKISTIFPDLYLVEGLIEYNVGKLEGIQPELNNIKKSYHYMINSSEDNSDAEDLPVVDDDSDNSVIPLPPTETNPDDGGIDSEDDGLGDSSNGGGPMEESYYTSDSYYKKKGNTCVLVEQNYINGQLSEQKEISVSKDEYVYCGIYDYIFNNTDSQGNNSNIVVDEDYLLTNQNEESNLFIYYTVNKNDVVPKYYNSGIKATADGEISYNQMKDVLFQIAIKCKGFSTDSNTKSLAVLSGIPIVVSDEKELYTKKETDSFLDSFDEFGIKVDKEVSVQKSELEEFFSGENIAIFNHEGKEIRINGLYVKDLNLMVPVQEVVGHFGYKTAIKNGKLLITKNDFKLELSVNANEYVLNGEPGKFKASIIKSQNEWFAEINDLFNLMGYDVKWDKENVIFEVSTLNP